MEYVDHLAVLGLKAGATQQEIKAAYRTYVKAFHPDRFPGDEPQRRFAELKTQEINAAYQYLWRNPYQPPTPPTQAAQAEAPKAQAARAESAHQHSQAKAQSAQTEATAEQPSRPSWFHKIAMGPVGNVVEWIGKAYMGLAMGLGLLGWLVSWAGGAWTVSIGLGLWVIWLKLTRPAVAPEKPPRTMNGITYAEYSVFLVGMAIVAGAFLVGWRWGCIGIPIYLWFSWFYSTDVRINRRIRLGDSDAISSRYAQYIKMGWTSEKADEVINRIRKEGATV